MDPKVVLKPVFKTKTKNEKIEFVWTIEKFEELARGRWSQLYSPQFSCGPAAELRWRIGVKTAGCTWKDSSYPTVHIYLLHIPKWMTEVLVEFEVSIQKAGGEQEKTASLRQAFTADNIPDLQCSMHVPTWQLINGCSSGLLTDGNLTLVCTVSAFFLSEKNYTISTAVADNADSDDENVDAADEVGSLAADLGRMLAAGQDQDVTLVAGDVEFPAHRALLAGRSAVFRAMFQHPLLEQQEGRVTIADLEPETVRQLLRFIYTGGVEQLADTAAQLLPAADKYQLPGLLALCQRQLSTQLSGDNCVDTLILAHLHSAARLKAKAMETVVEQGAAVMKGSAWERLLAHPALVAELCQAQGNSR